MWGILLKKAINTSHHTTQHGVHTVLYPSCLGVLGQTIVNYVMKEYYSV